MGSGASKTSAGAKKASATRSAPKKASGQRLAEMKADPDMVAERLGAVAITGKKKGSEKPVKLSPAITDVPLNVVSGTHYPNEQTLALLQEVGGVKGILKFTTAFYKMAFQDPHLDQFIRAHDDPHGIRFATWIAEKFGDPSKPWSKERRKRKTCPFAAHGHSFTTPHDRSSAHFAAWHSPKRARDVWGDHFNLSDARNWMRLHFWAMRQVGLFESAPNFCNYYTLFIGHFVRVYERTAPPFVRDSVRWSEKKENTERYLKAGRVMRQVLSPNSLGSHLKQLPADEAEDEGWPYHT